jgi:hypothetical protein
MLACCTLLGCSGSGDSSGSTDPCPIVRWWADTSGSVSQPGDAPESLAEAQGITDSFPGDEGETFLLSSNMSDAAYGPKLESFVVSYC